MYWIGILCSLPQNRFTDKKKRGNQFPLKSLLQKNYFFAISLNRSTTRFENPASLSYQDITFTILSPITLVHEASTIDESGLPLKSMETSGSSQYPRIPFSGPLAEAFL